MKLLTTAMVLALSLLGGVAAAEYKPPKSASLLARSEKADSKLGKTPSLRIGGKYQDTRWGSRWKQTLRNWEPHFTPYIRP